MSKVLFLLVGGDFVMAALAYVLGFMVQVRVLPQLRGEWLVWGPKLGFFALVLVLTSHLTELYSIDRAMNKKTIFLRIAGSLALALLVLAGVYRLAPELSLSLEVVLLSLAAFGLVQFVWHDCYPALLRSRGMAKKILILGVGPLAGKIGEALKDTTHNYVLAGFVQPEGEAATVPATAIVAPAERLFETASREKVQKIVISLSERRGVLPVSDLLQCRFNGIEVVDAISFHEATTGKLLINHTNPGWFIYGGGFRDNLRWRWFKRVSDLLLAAFGLLLTLPFFPLIALVIKLDCPGPVFFRQVRVGQKGRPFELIKFRTMCQNAEAATGAVWAQANDCRITRVGRFLRKSRIDEIPQLFNVLRGEMALVGPRPERPEFVRQLEEKVPYYGRRHAVKPGVTGWAQVRFPYGASVEDALEKLKYDLYYIKNHSLTFDLLIVLETVKVVLFGRGGR